MYKSKLLKVVDYLEGKLNIYDGKHRTIIDAWNDVWDEMRWMGYDPEDPKSIKKYIKEEL